MPVPETGPAVIEVFSALMKRFHDRRLFANMLAGHIMILCIVW